MKYSFVVSRCPEASTAPINDSSALILDLSSRDGVPLRFEGSALAIWDALAEPIEFDVLCRRMAELYGTSESEIRPDVEEFISRLITAHLARVDETPR